MLYLKQARKIGESIQEFDGRRDEEKKNYRFFFCGFKYRLALLCAAMMLMRCVYSIISDVFFKKRIAEKKVQTTDVDGPTWRSVMMMNKWLSFGYTYTTTTCAPPENFRLLPLTLTTTQTLSSDTTLFFLCYKNSGLLGRIC